MKGQHQMKKGSFLKPKGTMQELFAIREIKSDCFCLKIEGGKKDEREYRAVIEVDPINFSLLSPAEQESVLEGFRILLTRISYPLFIHIRLLPYDLSPYLAQLDHAVQHAPVEALRIMAEDQKQFVLELASSRALLQRRFYLIVPADQERVSKQNSALEIFDRARSQLDLRVNDLLADLERIGLPGAHRLSALELAHYYQSCLSTTHAHDFPLSESHLAAINHPIQAEEASSLRNGHSAGIQFPSSASSLQQRPAQGDVSSHIFPNLRVLSNQQLEKKRQTPSQASYSAPVQDMQLLELLSPVQVEVNPSYVRVVAASQTTQYLRGFAVIGYPSQVSAGWLGRLIQIDEPEIELMLVISPLETAPMVARLNRRLVGYRATMRLEERRGRVSDPYIAAAHKQVERLREQLVAQDERVFGVSLYLLVRGSTRKQLKERSARLLSLLKSLELVAATLALEHHKAWQCCLPDGRDILSRRKVLDTSSLTTAFPFASPLLSTEQGILVGVVPTNGSLVVLDPRSPSLDNGHEIKFARSGAGKSYDEKVRLGRALLAGYSVIVIDPENEYQRFAHRFGGNIVRLATGAFQLNPLDLPTEAGWVIDGRNLLEEKIQSLLIFFDLLLAEKAGTLTQQEKAYLSKCLYEVYQSYLEAKTATSGASPNPRQPNMRTLYHVVRSEQCGPDPSGLADRLQRHLGAFPKATTANLDGHLLIFSIRDLDPELRPAGLFLITEFVWNQIRKERHPRPRILSIDEAWTLLQTIGGGHFLSSLIRRARKYNLQVRTISQDVEDFLSSEWGRTILANSAMKFLMKQDSTSIDAVTRAFRLSEGERRYLLSCGKGEGLFFARNSHVPLRVVASAAEHALATTDSREEEQMEFIPEPSEMKTTDESWLLAPSTPHANDSQDAQEAWLLTAPHSVVDQPPHRDLPVPKKTHIPPKRQKRTKGAWKKGDSQPSSQQGESPS